MRFVPIPVTLHIGLDTDFARAPFAGKSGCFWGKFMSALAMSFYCILSRNSDSTHEVFSLRNGLKMGRVYARAITTKMIDLKTLWDFALVDNIGNTVRVILSASEVNDPVIGVLATSPTSGPHPAFSDLFKLFVKSILNWPHGTVRYHGLCVV